jgi:CO/xanthine dehydrogenase FAD-binding subunit
VLPKFRIRNAIGFPIVSVAFCATRETAIPRRQDGAGAVAPVPMRVRAVEKLLEAGTGPEPAMQPPDWRLT